MNSCMRCLGRGFIEDSVLIHDGVYGSLRQCPVCKDTRAYSREVERRYAPAAKKGKILEFKKKEVENEKIS